MLQDNIGQVTESERDEILRLHERRTGLKELLLTIDSPYLSVAERELLKNRVDEDLVRTNALFDSWWRRIGTKYHLKATEHGRWIIDFQTKKLSYEPPNGQSCEKCTPDDGSHR